MEKEKLLFPYEELNPVIKPETVKEIFNPGTLKSVHERINSVHPDFNKCGFTLASIRKTFSGGNFDDQYYLTGLKIYFDGRYRELQDDDIENLEPYAVDFARDLLGADTDAQSTKQSKSLNDKILSEFRGTIDDIPQFDASLYPRISEYFILRSRTNRNNFRFEQPYLVKHLSLTTLKGRFTEDDKIKLRSMIDGLVDGNKMFRVAQNKLYRKDFEVVDRTFAEFFKDKPIY